MRILGIDPGLQKCGWGIIESEGHALKFIACGHIATNVGDDMARRLAEIHEGILKIIKTYEPDSAAIEETFVNRNPASALKLGQARGVAMAVPALCGLSVSEYSANTIKKSIVGAGHAAKVQMGMMVKVLLPACGTPTADEADALAVAITHAHYASLPLAARM
ncbi:MAG: crossover junction endodeoxyribonuclease RuvC [Alphaproteobacteria bacterium]|nr:crossover junction endodeoxyribonuclease RuvC [Alphaproteobacteria bacterium]MCD8570589.1 crossover junction endodeoxyribonuclease RuvC [Alphaproteobacteria bacterium]